MSEVAGQSVVRDSGVQAPERTLPERFSSPTSARRRWWRDALRRRLLATADIGASALTVGVVIAISSRPELAWALAFIPLWLVIAKLVGLYDRDHRALRHLTADEVPQLIAWAATITALLALLLPLTPAAHLGGLEATAHAAVALCGAIVLRALARWTWWRRTPPELVGMIGDQRSLAAIRRKFRLFRDMRFELAAEREVSELGTGDRRDATLHELVEAVDRIVIAADAVDTDLIGELNALCRERQVKLSVVSPLRGKALPSTQISQVADLPILEYNTWDPSRSSVLIKRLFDVGVASVGLLILLPFLPLVALAIRLDSPGRAIFSQIRAGLGGRPFRMYKLRTMHLDAEARLEEVVDIDQLDEPAFKLRDDPRITRVGRLLRRFSIDELPQLFNVLVGEMSIVGPRPEQVELVERYSPEDRFRLTVKPGITGPMQIFGRGELTFAERLAVELEYVENPSLARDLKIIIHTIPAVWRGTGAF